jgi:hypothetical protein
MSQQLVSERLSVDSVEDAIELFYDRGWTDGDPVVPPTEKRIVEFLEYAGLEPEQVIGEIPERDRLITAEKLAINSVMAGCKAEYMPVLVAAVEAICHPDFKFNHIATLGSAWPLLIVNGPLGKELGFNSGMYLFSAAGNRPSSTVARAISLLLWNCAEARPDGIQRGQWGNPGRGHYCVAENEESSWDPLHVQLGFDRETSTVTALSTYPGPYQVYCQRTAAPELMLDSIVDAISTYDFSRGTYPLFIPPHFADVFIGFGWSKNDVRDYVFEKCMRSVAELKRRGLWGTHSSEFAGYAGIAHPVEPGDDQRFAHVFKSDEYDRIMFDDTSLLRRSDIYVIMGGGNAGPRLCFIAPYGVSTDPVTVAIRGK